MSDQHQPNIAQEGPYLLELEAGTYWWCSCGHSQNQPFCDGSHKDKGFVPEKLVLEEPRKVYLCGCKHSNKKPFCDGAHNQL